MAPPEGPGEGAVAAGGGQQGQGQQRQQGGMGQTITGIIRMAVFWYFISKFISPKKAPLRTPPSLSPISSKKEIMCFDLCFWVDPGLVFFAAGCYWAGVKFVKTDQTLEIAT
ncbi:hypothetical protein OIU78_000908 [Salix suchowensis]|nr:hypothetical protein OIU78_000908 [Salix suchowensis]